MKIIFSKTLLEIGSINKKIDRIMTILKKGVFTAICKRILLPKSQLIRINYMNEVIFLLKTANHDCLFLFYGSKNSPIGKNMTTDNPKFKFLLSQRLNFIGKDIDKNALDIYIF